VREALGYVRRRRALAGLLGAQAAASIFFFAVVPIEVVYAKKTLDAGSSGYGWLLAAWGGGMIVGGIVFAAMQRARINVVIAAGTLAIGAAYMGLAAAPNLAVACVVSAVGGVGNGVQWVSVVNAVQELTSSSMQARVLGVLESIGAALPAVGFFAGGGVAAVASPRTAYVFSGAGVLLTLVVAGFLLRRTEWPGRGTVAPEDPAAAVGHGPAAS
jgi:MFS family permease